LACAQSGALRLHLIIICRFDSLGRDGRLCRNRRGFFNHGDRRDPPIARGLATRVYIVDETIRVRLNGRTANRSVFSAKISNPPPKKTAMISTIKIYPPIGVARLGNSPDGYFIGPEQPIPPLNPTGGYRDENGLIKRQAARFRLFGFDENGQPTGEVTLEEADDITWSVHVANTKAAADRFFGKFEANPGLRNAAVVENRDQLKLDPGVVSVSGKNPSFADLTASRAAGLVKEFTIDQQFLGQAIQLTLGSTTTDDEGRLLVLGGHGESKSPTGASLEEAGSNFANHDGWYDDVSDGVVSATVRLKDGSTPAVASAWVIVAPPKYAPGIHSVVTLYDTLFQAAVDRNLTPSPLNDPAFKPSIATDILPIVTRAANVRWVYSDGNAQFDPASFHHSFNNLPPAAKAAVFRKLAVPSDTPGASGTGGGDMPKMWSDEYQAGSNASLTRIQYKMLEMWKDGATVPGSEPSPGDPITPDGLTRAALEPCVGAAFYPGIEASWKLRDTFSFIEPFRLDATKMSPGDVSSQMSLPWQSDFLDCGVEPDSDGDELVWWPAQRPDNILKAGSDTYIPWARVSDGDPTEMSVEQMITGWSQLGFIVAADDRFEETLRA